MLAYRDDKENVVALRVLGDRALAALNYLVQECREVGWPVELHLTQCVVVGIQDPLCVCVWCVVCGVCVCVWCVCGGGGVCVCGECVCVCVCVQLRKEGKCSQ